MIDNGTQLTNLGMRLNNIGSQIQKISMDISLINNNYSIQLQNIGTQISNFSQQIFNIGMLIKNANSIQQPFGVQMINMINNNMNMINFDNVNIGMNMNNNINENMNDIIKEPNEKIIFVYFNNPLIRDTTNINISLNKTIPELLNSYRIKIGEDSDFFDKYLFLLNGRKINPNDNRTLFDYGIKMNGHLIRVIPLNSDKI